MSFFQTRWKITISVICALISYAFFGRMPNCFPCREGTVCPPCGPSAIEIVTGMIIVFFITYLILRVISALIHSLKKNR